MHNIKFDDEMNETLIEAGVEDNEINMAALRNACRTLLDGRHKDRDTLMVPMGFVCIELMLRQNKEIPDLWEVLDPCNIYLASGWSTPL